MAYAQVTLTQLRTYFYEQVGQNSSFFRTDEVDHILQESVRVFNVLTGYWRATVAGGTTSAGQHWYTTPAGLQYILRVELNGVPLSVSSLWDLDYGQTTWETDTASTGQAPTVWAPAGVNRYVLWPASLTGGETISVEGVVPAPVLTTVGFINIGQADLEMLLDYALHIAQFKEGGQEFDASQVSLQQFLKDAGERNSVLRQSSRFREWMGLTDEKKRPIRLPGEARVGAR